MTRITGPDCAVMCNLIQHTNTQKSARNRKIAADAVRETGERWAESEKM